mmetsp:Transcript_16135/g.37779  ORF Transcript_16135/g.37779 Transcript_16135/m.37779 type:complete len:231 (+) Transcript_16135:1087-1779(+)
MEWAHWTKPQPLENANVLGRRVLPPPLRKDRPAAPLYLVRSQRPPPVSKTPVPGSAAVEAEEAAVGLVRDRSCPVLPLPRSTPPGEAVVLLAQQAALRQRSPRRNPTSAFAVPRPHCPVGPHRGQQARATLVPPPLGGPALQLAPPDALRAAQAAGSQTWAPQCPQPNPSAGSRSQRLMSSCHPRWAGHQEREAQETCFARSGGATPGMPRQARSATSLARSQNLSLPCR